MDFKVCIQNHLEYEKKIKCRVYCIPNKNTTYKVYNKLDIYFGGLESQVLYFLKTFFFKIFFLNT